MYSEFATLLSIDSLVDTIDPETLANHYFRHGTAAASDPILKKHLDGLRAVNAYYRVPSLDQLVKEYKEKHRRNPPPRFDLWYQYALNNSCADFYHFDSIYKNLEPFWSVSPKVLKSRIRSFWGDDSILLMLIRDGKPLTTPHGERGNDRADSMQLMLRNISVFLPDMEIPLNFHDEPRLTVPYNVVQKARKQARLPKGTIPSSPQFSDFTMNLSTAHYSFQGKHEWVGKDGQAFTDLEEFCSPDSPVGILADAGNVSDVVSMADSMYRSDNIIIDANTALDLCVTAPLLQDLHSYLIAPLKRSELKTLVPIFSEAKTTIHSDIIIPATSYYNSEAGYGYDPTGDCDWTEKKDVIFWAGTSSGGYIKDDNVDKMLRNRLVYAFNASLPNTPELKSNVSIFCPTQSGMMETCRVNLTDYISKHGDVYFVRLDWCNEYCYLMEDRFEVKPKVTPTMQFQNKYLLDVDGNSFSGRYLSFLKSNSLPFKATIFQEWHDSRLIPWVHYVPIDSRLNDLYRVITYFTGFEGVISEHDDMAQRIALEGQRHANKVLRRQDMEIYMFLLLLEYARLLDDQRDTLGFSL
ncbi:glycosyltransferase family 90 protein [Tortispora caseinolytica NRRL Y-17796]|uniref:Glycosyltransferase family 90 protein n=1 Tax=Tortispora caseinolytica NRRL Y-17796 TaxID=767744 RepID=A0A1E4TF45_9ASCO|nr:glycosyltransferase family 90 protein [Tortispora caseinolytica NRRL Y-17796]